MNDSLRMQRWISRLLGLAVLGISAFCLAALLLTSQRIAAGPADDHPGGFSQADRLDLQADVDGSGSITGLDEHCEETSGVLVLLNRDDDNANGVWDYLETGHVAGEDDLVQITISPSDLASGGLWLSGLGGSLRVWTSADKSTGTELVATQGDYHLWDLDTSPTYPATLYVEGIAASSVARDKELILHWNGYIFDTIKFSVLEVDLDMDSNLDGTVDDNDNTAGEDEDIEESLTRGLGAVIGFDGPAQVMKWQILPSDVTGDAMSIYEKNGQNDAVKVYEDSSLMDELELPASWPYPWSSGPASTLYVVGLRPSEEVSDLELVLAIQRGQSSLTDTVRATVVQCDLDVDANYDGEIDDEDWLTTGDDALEFTSGGLVAVDSITTLTLDLTPHGIVDYGLTTVTLSCLAGADHFTLYTSPTCESASSITLPMTWDQSTPATAMPAQLYFRGDSVSNYREVRLKLSTTQYDWGTYPDYRTFSDEIAMTVYKVDLGIDVNCDGIINETDETSETLEGGMIAYNGDDDNYNEIEDLYETTRSLAEDDLTSITMSFYPDLDFGHLTLSQESGHGLVRIYPNRATMTEMSLPKTWDLSTEDLPAEFCVEGIQASQSLCDVGFKLTYTYLSETSSDEVAATVVQPDLKIDCDWDGDIDEDDNTLELNPSGAGGLVMSNRDDDNNNGWEDMWEWFSIPEEDDLERMTLELNPSVAYVGTSVTLTADWYTGFYVRIWDSPTRDNRIYLGQTWPSSSYPSTVYVEGVYPMYQPGLVKLKMQCIKGTSFKADDPVAITTYGVQRIEVKPIEQDESAYSDSCAIAEGGYNSDVHKANVRILISPRISGAPIPIELINANGYGPERQDAILSIFDGSTTQTIEGNSSGTVVLYTNASGEFVGVLSSSNQEKTNRWNPAGDIYACQIKSLGHTAEVEFEWADLQWDSPKSVYYETYTPISVILKQRNLAMDQHQIQFIVGTVTYYEWDSVNQRWDIHTRHIDDTGWDVDDFVTFHDDDSGGGDGIVTDHTTPGTYTSYIYVEDRSAEDIFTAHVHFWAADYECYDNMED